MKLLIIAGEGELPKEVSKGALSQGYQVVVFNFSPSPFEGKEVYNFKLEELPRALRLLEKISPDQAVMAGKVEHKLAFSSLIKNPSLIPIVKRLRGKRPLEILQSLGELLEERGVKMVSPLEFVSHLVAQQGERVGKFSEDEIEQVRMAFSTAKKIAEMDIGQSIAWKEGAVVAVEAMEGTDEMIRRAGKLVRDFMVVKVSRPAQDLRYDLPVVGLSTFMALEEAGAKSLVIEEGRTLFLQREESLKLAKKNGIKVISWKESN